MSVTSFLLLFPFLSIYAFSSLFEEELSQIAIQKRKRYGVGNFTRDF
jgi:hypothetical protein